MANLALVRSLLLRVLCFRAFSLQILMNVVFLTMADVEMNV